MQVYIGVSAQGGGGTCGNGGQRINLEEIQRVQQRNQKRTTLRCQLKKSWSYCSIQVKKSDGDLVKTDNNSLEH